MRKFAIAKLTIPNNKQYIKDSNRYKQHYVKQQMLHCNRKVFCLENLFRTVASTKFIISQSIYFSALITGSEEHRDLDLDHRVVIVQKYL